MPGPNPILNLPFILAGMGEGSRGYVQGMQAEDEHERNQAMLQQLVKRSAFEQQMQGPELAEMQNRARLSQVQATSAEEEEQPLDPQELGMYNSVLSQMGKPEIPPGIKKKDARAMLSTMGSLTRQVSPLTLQDMRDRAAASRLATQEAGKNNRMTQTQNSTARQRLVLHQQFLQQQIDQLSKSGDSNNLIPAWTKQLGDTQGDIANFDRAGQPSALGDSALDPDQFDLQQGP